MLDGEIEDYEYLNKSRREVDGIDDREEWNLLKVCTKPCPLILQILMQRDLERS